MNEQPILERIKKLLALSRSSNPSEAAIALSRAQKLMREHSISMNDVNLSVIGQTELDAPPALRARSLMGALGNIICNSFGIDYFFHMIGSKINSVVFIGPKDRIEIAAYTFTLLSRQLANIKKEFAKKERARLRAHTENYIETCKREYLLNTAKIFRLPPELILNELMHKFKNDEDRQVRKNTEASVYGYLKTIEYKVQKYALSINEQKLIAQYITKNYPNLTSTHSRAKTYTKDMMDSYKRGNKDAQNFNIFHGIKGQNSDKLMLIR